MPRHSLWTGLAVFTIDRGTCRNVGCGKDANAFFTLLSHVKRTTELSSVRASKWLVLYSKPCSSFHVSSTHCRVPFGPIGHVASENDRERPGKARHLSTKANTSPTQGETDTASDPEPTSRRLALTPARTNACPPARAQITWRSTLSSRSPSCALSSTRPLLSYAASRRATPSLAHAWPVHLSSEPPRVYLDPPQLHQSIHACHAATDCPLPAPRTRARRAPGTSRLTLRMACTRPRGSTSVWARSISSI